MKLTSILASPFSVGWFCQGGRSNATVLVLVADLLLATVRLPLQKVIILV